jgi:DNA-binding NarL/FixJ family response regulator
METYRIVLTDDHILIRQGLRKILESVEGLEVIGEAGNGAELLGLLGNVEPDMIILDMSMPNLKGIEAIDGIRDRCPDAQILVLSMHKEYLHQALDAGVNGYLLKEDADRELFFAIDTIRQGGTFLSPRLAGALAMGGPRRIEALSNREKDVLRLIASGKSNREIGGELHISVRTVESHRANIMAKLEVSNAAELIRFALKHGYD